MGATDAAGDARLPPEDDACVKVPAYPVHANMGQVQGASPLTLALASAGMERVGWTMWMLTMCAALSGSLFGYDTGYVSSVLVTIGDDFGHELSDGEQTLITSATSLGALIGAICAALPSDWLGRKMVIATANVVFIIGAVVQAAAHNVWTMIGGRFVVGIGVGVASMIVPLWIGELAPAHMRGRLVTLNVVFLTLGQVIAEAVGLGFEHVHGGWRFVVSGGAIPAIVSLISMAWLPESPRFDSRRGRTDRAVRTFQRIYPHATEEYCRLRANELAESLQRTQHRLGGHSLRSRVRLLLTGPNARALAIACGLQALQQLSGFNTLMYYSGTLFQSVGFSNPLVVPLIVGATNFAGTLVALKYIDIIGRRRVMLATVPIMTLSLAFTAICFRFLDKIQLPDGTTQYRQNTWTYLSIVAIIVYVLGYAIGTGNVPWQQGELFALEARSIGTSLATATNWSCNLLIGATYLKLVDAATSSGAFGFYAGLCALGFVFCFFCFPDTRTLSLEEVQSIFRHSWGIRAADELRAEKARIAYEARARDIETPTPHTNGSDQATAATGALRPSSHSATPRVPVDDESVDLATIDSDKGNMPLRDTLDEYVPAPAPGLRMDGAAPAMPLSLPADIAPVPEFALRRSTTLPYPPGHDVHANAIRPPHLLPDDPARYAGLRGESLMLFVTCFASLGVFLFGYDQGVMSGILTHRAFRHFFRDPTPAAVGTMVAILEIGALITSLLAGVLADRYGRKRVLVWGALLFSLGGLIQTMATGVSLMVVGRFVAGFGVGFLSMIVPTYQSEVSPAENRGKLACIEFTGNIIGYMSSVWVGYACSFFKGNAAWRLPLLLQPVIGLVLAFGSVLLPESPRWLCDNDDDDGAMRVLADLHQDGDPRLVRAKLEYWEIKTSVQRMRAQGDRSYRAMWKGLRYRTLIGMSSQACAQLNGINVISYYAPLVFESAGWVGRDALLMTGLNAVVYVASTVPTWFLVDTWGRRPILLSGALLCAIMLCACGLFLRADTSYTPAAVVVCVVLFNAAFGYSWGPIPWAWTPEIMPLAFRAKGASLAAATNWVFNYVVGQLTPVLQATISWRLYLMHAGFCLASFALVYFFYPETQGVPLEEMDVLFGDDAAPVPQHDGDDTADDARSGGSDSELPHVRYSISAHWRFSEEAHASDHSHRWHGAAQRRADGGHAYQGVPTGDNAA